MNNPKDIPFALAYVMSILGIIRFNSFCQNGIGKQPFSLDYQCQ